MGRAGNLLSVFAVGLGIYVLHGQGFIPPAVTQLLMLAWVLGLRYLAMPVIQDAAAAGDERAAAAAAAADEQQTGGGATAAVAAAAGGDGKSKKGRAGKAD